MEKNYNKMSKALKKFGIVIQCAEVGGMFHVQIGEGYDNKFTNTHVVSNIILDALNNKFPFIHRLVVDKNKFHMILKEKSCENKPE